MSARNHAVSARSTIGSLFAPGVTIGLGITFSFNFSPQEEARIVIIAPPTMSRSRVKFCLDSSSPIYHPSISPSDSTHLNRAPKPKPYKGIDLDRSNQAILDEVATSASRCRGASDPDVFSTTSRGKHVFSISASDSPLSDTLGLGAPRMRSRDSARGGYGASRRWDKDKDILDMPASANFSRGIQTKTTLS